MKKSKKQIILRGIILAVISLIIGLGVYSWNAKNLTGNVMPMPFGLGVGVVLTGSMEPDISPNDVIVVTAKREYSVGETVVYQNGYMLVVHRIVSIDGDTVVTRGIANNTDDEPIKLSDIKGKVVMVIPWIGTVVLALKTPIATLIILAVAIWLLVRSYQNERAEDNEQIESIKKQIEELKRSSSVEQQPNPNEENEEKSDQQL